MMKQKFQIEDIIQEKKPGSIHTQLHTTRPTELKNPLKNCQKHTNTTVKRQMRTKYRQRAGKTSKQNYGANQII